MDAVILAGGKGSRMEDSLPKKSTGKINKIILQIGYKADQIIDYIKKNYPNENIEFSIESEPLGTGGAIKQGLKKATTDFVLVFNCDDLTDINIGELEKLQENTICIAHPQLPFGMVFEENGYAKFEEKPTLKEWVSCGWYLFNRKDMISKLPDKGSLEYDVFPKVKIRTYKHENFWVSLNTKKDITEFEKT